MRVKDILLGTDAIHSWWITNGITNEIEQFLNESKGLPLLKNLPSAYSDAHRVKVRFKKPSQFAETFNLGFENVNKLHQRAIFANGKGSFVRSQKEDQEPFFIFPINGYRCLYCKEITQSESEYKRVFDSVFEQFGTDSEHAIGIISDLLKYTYNQDNLYEGIASNAEIVLYGIPYYYAIRQTSVTNYQSILEFAS